MKVYYPHGGRAFLLHWYTYNEGGHIILASSERAMNVVARRVIKEHDAMEIKAAYEIEIVAPSPKMNELDAEFTLSENVECFHQDIIQRLSMAQEVGRTLPAPFAVCKDFKSKYDDEEYDKYDSEHYNCKNCYHKIKLVNTTPEQLYNDYSAAWYAKNPKRLDKRVESNAVQANDTELLMYVVSDFGHHRTGIGIKSVENVDVLVQRVLSIPVSDRWERPDFISNDILFYFRNVRNIDVTELNTMMTNIRYANELKSTTNTKMSHDKYELEMADEVINLFAK